MQQLSLFDNPIFKINKPILLIELFAGIGSQAKALKRIGADFEHYRVCEFDKYAVNSYNAIHGTNFVTSDITQLKATDLGIVDTEKYCYIMTYSFPCQDLSLAGKQKGMAKGENTRSGLLWEVERLLNECTELPQVLLMENVTQVHGKKNKEHFEQWIKFLESKGYSNYWQDLNAKDFGIPQNRNRCFMVSLLGNYSYKFPEEFPLTLRLKDMLEDAVDEKFYLSEKGFDYVFNMNNEAKGIGFSDAVDKSFINPDVCNTLSVKSTGSHYQRSGTSTFVSDSKKKIMVADFKKRIEVVQIGNCCPTKTRDNPNQGRIYNTEGLAPCLNQMGGGNRQPFILGGMQKNQAIKTDGVCTCLTSSMGMGGGYVPMHNYTSDFRIRKLTPKECFRLMGFSDEDFAKAEAVNSNTQLYKQAGNSIVVDVLAHIFKSLL